MTSVSIVELPETTAAKFTRLYCKKYKIILTSLIQFHNGGRRKRLKGNKLNDIKILCFILKLYCKISSREVEILTNLAHESVIKFYYDVLGDPIFREEAKRRYEEIVGGRNISKSISS